ncbi:MAG: exodeoxyribonuclease VII small subunit [Proteobacteria bacterium]|nr:MAG: exodeoxyribonuclease VII small subunit [Pseudomonadota bacterium]PIE18559.1 MAG: exodeoxyribonuclease VII small subunit [Pseudomonadota bacterium]
MSESTREAPASKDDPERFDALLEQLEAIVEQLDNSDLPLEESLRAFERGVALSRRGQQILDEAERKVEVLLRDGSRDLIDELPDPEENR